MKRIGIMMMGLLVGCSAGEQAGTRSSAIAEVKIERTATRLELTALTASGASYGALVLQLADFVDVEEYGPEPVYGRTLTVTAGEQTLRHQSKGTPPLDLPLVSSQANVGVIELLGDERVAAELARWDVRFSLAGDQSSLTGLPEGEAAQDTCTYAANSACGSGECWQAWGGPPTTQYRCCETAGSKVERLCSGNPGGTNACGAVGPLGCSVCWSEAYSSFCRAYGGGFIDGNNCIGEGWPCDKHVECCELSGCIMGSGGYKNCGGY